MWLVGGSPSIGEGLRAFSLLLASEDRAPGSLQLVQMWAQHKEDEVSKLSADIRQQSQSASHNSPCCLMTGTPCFTQLNQSLFK